MFNCRSCYSSDLHSIIPLGMMPLANALLAAPPNSKCKTYNLEVMLCKNCGLAQLKDIVDPKELFSNYVYFSSNSETMLKSAFDLVESIIPTLSQNSLVIEIASNDGYLLKNYVQKNIDVLGIDPAENIVLQANLSGVKTLCNFFSYELSQRLKEEGKQADIIHANNVLAHVPDINNFINGLKNLLKPKGKIIIEVPYFLDLVQKLEFDTIYHEHVYYFALKPLITVFARHGLHIFDIEKLSIHGGTLRLFVSHIGEYKEQNIVNEMLKLEESSGLFDLDSFKIFMTRLLSLKKNLIQTLNSIKKQNNIIAAYGASAKGTTLLNYFKLGQYIDYVVDRSIEKQEKYTPGTHLKIMSPEILLKNNVSYALLLAWNFADEIISQQKVFINNGGKFILPLPEVKITV